MPLYSNTHIPGIFVEFEHALTKFAPNSVFDTGIALLKPSKEAKYLYNTEQLTRTRFIPELKEHAKTKRLIDYSMTNISILQPQIEQKILYFPILFSPDLIQPKKEKIYDVAFIGYITPRRAAILRELSKTCQVMIINTYAYLEKYRQIFSAKVLLNVHAETDFQVFEFSRCSIPVFNGQVVISEDADVSKETGTNAEVVKHVIFSPYDQLVTKVKEVLKDYSKYTYKLDVKIFQKCGQDDLDNFCKEI